jgi:hypothetical protein
MNGRRAIAAGLAASVVMGMIEMVYEAVAGDGFWSPVVYIGATVLRRLQEVRPPVGFDFWGVILGLGGHMMNSAVLGVVFAALAGRGERGRGAAVIWGAVYGLVVFIVMWYVVVPRVDPVMGNLHAGVFALSHVVWGVVLARVLFPAGQAAGRPAAT